MSQAKMSLSFSSPSKTNGGPRTSEVLRTPGQECSPIEDNADHQRYSRVDEQEFTDHHRAVFVGLHMGSSSSYMGADEADGHHHRRHSHSSHHGRSHHHHHHRHHHHSDGNGGHHHRHHGHQARRHDNKLNQQHSRQHNFQSDDDSMAPLRSSFSLDNDDSPLPGPSERVRHLLNQSRNEEGKETHELFTELEELHVEGGVMEWKERARWVKYEEDVEWGGDKWSKPHVAALSLHSLFELRSCILQGTVLLNMDATDLTTIADLVLDDLVATSQLDECNRPLVRSALLCRHKHQGEHKPKLLRRATSEDTQAKQETATQVQDALLGMNGDVDTSQLRQNSMMGQSPAGPRKLGKDSHFMKKLPPNAEASNVLVGQVDFLHRPLIAFVRLAKSFIVADLTEVPIPTRFLFILLGPKGEEERYHEIGRSISTLMADPVFHDVAYQATSRADLLAGVDEFLDQVVVLPPGEWDPTIRLPPPSSPRKTAERLMANASAPCPSREKHGGGGGGGGDGNGGEDDYPGEDLHHAGLKRTKRLFGGLVDDVKRRWPFYFWSDFREALHPQVIPAIIFIYFACIAPTITFGGLLEDSTGGYMGTMEMIIASCFCGVVYSLFSGQPLTILGATGPMLVFEGIVYSFSVDNGIPFLQFRFWIGMWTALFLIVMVAVDASALIGFFTRFTEETFSALISFIFIYEAILKISKIQTKYPPLGDFYVNRTLEENCTCALSNGENVGQLPSNLTLSECTGSLFNGTAVGPGCPPAGAEGDIFFLSFIEFFGTFLIAYSLKSFRGTGYFPTKVRVITSDFAVIIAIAVMIVVDVVYKVNTPKLFVPLTFEPTKSMARGWLVEPLGKGAQPWLPFAAIVPAVLAVILVFMDQQISALLVNRREHKLKKGPGYHLDLLVVAVLIAICSVFGLPWLVAATVRSLTHVNSLSVIDSNTAPGEKPKFLGVREQRVTNLCVFVLHGLSILAAPALRYVPLPILYGLFLYMGVASLRGVQFVERLELLIMPAKFQYDVYYVRHVPVLRMHLFTLVQLLSLVVLCVVKLTDAKLVFPIAVLGLVGVRHCMKYLFTDQELEILDDKMPELLKRKKQDAGQQVAEHDKRQRELDLEEAMLSPTATATAVPDGVRHRQSNGGLRHQPPSLQQGGNFNISHELDRCDLWQHTHSHTCKPTDRLVPPPYSVPQVQNEHLPLPAIRESAL